VSENYLELLNLYEHLQKRPGMFIGRYDPERLAILFTGIHLTIKALDLQLYWDLTKQQEAVFLEHGWHYLANPIEQMQARNMDDKEIVTQIVGLEFEALKRAVAIQGE